MLQKHPVNKDVTTTNLLKKNTLTSVIEQRNQVKRETISKPENNSQTIMLDYTNSPSK
jgi:hypothetical protein